MMKSKVISIAGLSFSLMSFSAFAETKDVRDYLDLNADVRVAAEAMAKEIRDDHNNNHTPIPGHHAYKDLNIVSVDPMFQGTFEVNPTTKFLTRIEFTHVAFKAVGVPLFSDYGATISLIADFNEDCSKIVNGSRSYTVIESNSSLVDALFKKDLTGRNYNTKYYAYADVVFESLLKTNSYFREFCPNFVMHSHTE